MRVPATVELKQAETPEKTKDTILDEVKHDFADWLTADRDLVWRPAIELTEKNNEFTVRALVGGVDLKDVEVLVAPEMMLIKAETQADTARGTVHRSEFASGKLRRLIEFPRAVNPNGVRAEIKDGMLCIKARIAKADEAKMLRAA
jgi:HSP20 family protein